ncbi:MAG: hypothetical protein KKA42_12975 [candidate division Zixibacteria bacterium]|nr:hypothetical protein [candidate division Zixibacteria bacterium]
MKARIIIAITILLGMVCLAGVQAQETTNLPPRQLSKAAFGIRVSYPMEWQVFRNFEDETDATMGFSLPKVMSEEELAEIENAVIVSAYKRPEIANLDQLMSFETARLRNIIVSSVNVAHEFGKAQQVVTRLKGLQYKSLNVFRFENGVGYVLTFTATPGTYDLNIDKFESFLKAVEFYAPEASQPREYQSRMQEAIALYQGGPRNAARVIELLEAELKENPGNPMAVKLLGITYFGTERFQDAIGLFDKAMELANAPLPRLQFYKANALYELDRYQEASDILKTIEEFCTNDKELGPQYLTLARNLDAAITRDKARQK